MSIDAAVAALRAGGVVVFPTETVYGIGVDVRSPAAVDRLLRVRGRDDGKPLLVLVCDLAMAALMVATVPPAAARLAARFWPGPLTLVLPARADLPAAVTAGTGTIGLRVSSHPLAAQLLAAFDSPVTAPSANPPGAAPATTLTTARDYFGPTVDCYLDGGPSHGGASTVAVVEGSTVRVLRPGPITADALNRALED